MLYFEGITAICPFQKGRKILSSSTWDSVINVDLEGLTTFNPFALWSRLKGRAVLLSKCAHGKLGQSRGRTQIQESALASGDVQRMGTSTSRSTVLKSMPNCTDECMKDYRCLCFGWKCPVAAVVFIQDCFRSALQGLSCAKLPLGFTGQQLWGQSYALPRSRAAAWQV